MSFHGSFRQRVFVFDVRLNDRIDRTAVDIQKIESIPSAIIHPTGMNQKSLFVIIASPDVENFVANLGISERIETILFIIQ